MPANLKYSVAARNNQLTSLNTDIGASCKIALYDGAQPAGPGTAITSQVKLVEWTGNAGGFGAVSAGALTASAVATVNAIANGTATWFRISTSGGAAVVDGSAGTSASDMILTSAAIVSGSAQQFSSMVITGGNA